MLANTTAYDPAVDPLNPFGYVPSYELAIASTVVYAVVTLLITILSIYYRTWFFVVMTISGISEIVGYAYRWSLSKSTDQLTPYIIMSCCIILAPVGLAFTDYLIVGRLIRTAGRQYSLVNAKVVEVGFILSDFLSICIQSAGAGLVSRGTLGGNLSEANLGSDVLIAGLVINLVSFCCFAVVTLHFHWSISRRSETFTGREKWVKMFYALYLSMTLLIVRSAYRVIEFALGFRGYIATHEVYFYVFECLLIILAFGLFIPLHPGIWMSTEETEKSRLIPRENVSPIVD